MRHKMGTFAFCHRGYPFFWLQAGESGWLRHDGVLNVVPYILGAWQWTLAKIM